MLGLRPFLKLFGPLLLGCLVSGNAGATLLYYNLTDTLNVADQVSEPLYESFTSGPTILDMDDLKLNLILGTADSGTFTIYLYSDSSDSPGTNLLTIATVSDTTLSTTEATYDYPVADYALSANTQYWIELVAGNGVNAKWDGAQVAGGDTGTSGQHIDLNGAIYPTNSNFAFEMSIDAITPQTGGAPEPSSGLLLGAGLAAAWWLRRAR